jgi:phosphate/sulfate permease
MKEDLIGETKLNPLRILALVVAVVGALGSLAMMFHAGRNNKSVLLMALFTAWVVSPFLVLILAAGIFKRWPFSVRKKLYILMLMVAAVSLVGYSGILSPPHTKPAFMFLVIPLLSWIVMTIAYFAIIRRGKG